MNQIERLNKNHVNPLISVIIPVFNIEKYLPRCLDSVLGQTYPYLQIILVNDGSSDSSGQICEVYKQKDARVQVIHQNNSGVSVARNMGLENATGEYISFVDGDDWIERDMYQYLLNLCDTYHTTISICNFSREKFRTVYQQPCRVSTRKWLANPQKIVSACGRIFHRSLLGNTQFKQDIIIGEDSLFSTELLAKTDFIAYGPEAYYHYTTNPFSAMHQTFKQKNLTYFKANEYEEHIAINKKWPEVAQTFRMSKVNTTINFIKQIIWMKEVNPKTLDFLLSVLRENRWEYLFHGGKWSARFFVLTCCINFNIVRVVYRILNDFTIKTFK